ncbi:AAA family ATPase [Mameliella sp. CS4]|uniref:AAA family ATPase n=1 Tax=Mameliella sp. CS4 TaxID=2862329 RepID=UPI001C5DDD41|nr:AAA family ATPase [Mameliella sp. CS4]MBW4981017.1 AAA family ATPase [Mameliella sp. CS4]
MDNFLTEMLTRAVGSDFFAGGLALGAFGAAIGILRMVYGMARAQARRRWAVSLTVDNRSEAYRHLYVWLDRKGVLRRIRQVQATGVRAGRAEIFAPAEGRHWFLHGGRLCSFERSLREKTRVGGDGGPMEVLTVTMLFGRSEVLRGWVDEGAAMCAAEEERAPILHVLRGDWWDHVCEMPRRALETILAEDDRIERLRDDMAWFYENEDWYRTRGVPWRRGYLLYGPPGTGKSSVIRALASDLGKDLASVSLASAGLTDEDLRSGLASAPKGAFLVLEDIDASFAGRGQGEARSGISFSGLLNAIDGVAAQEGRVLVMTTNHPERLDPALIRPGRADVHLELGPVPASVAADLFRRFFPGEEALAERFADALGTRRVTPAALQGWLLSHAQDPVAASSAKGLLAAPGAERLAAE